MLRTQDFALAAGAALTVNARLTYARCLTLLGAPGCRVTVQLPAGGGDVPLAAGQGFDLGETAPGVILKNLSAGAISGTLIVGDGRFHDSQISGVVSVVDTERDKVLSGVAFRGQAAQLGGAAAAVASVMNPTGSVKNVFVQALRTGSSAADSYTIFRTTTDCRSVGGVLTSLTSGVNLDPAGAGSVVTLSGGNPAAGLGAFAGLSSFVSGYVSASGEAVVLFPRPILLRPGYGLCVSLTASASNIRTAWEWEEWPV